MIINQFIYFFIIFQLIFIIFNITLISNIVKLNYNKIIIYLFNYFIFIKLIYLYKYTFKILHIYTTLT